MHFIIGEVNDIQGLFMSGEGKWRGPKSGNTVRRVSSTPVRLY